MTGKHSVWVLGTQVGSSGRRQQSLSWNLVLCLCELHLSHSLSITTAPQDTCQSLKSQALFTEREWRESQVGPAVPCHLVTLRPGRWESTEPGVLPAAPTRDPAPCCSSGESQTLQRCDSEVPRHDCDCKYCVRLGSQQGGHSGQAKLWSSL